MGNMRVGVLTGERMPEYEWLALETMVERTDAEITLLVIDEGDKTSTGTHIVEMIEMGLWGLVHKLAWKFNTPAYQKTYPIDGIDVFDGVRTIRCSPIPADGIGNELPPDIVEIIANETDVVYRTAFGILKGDVLSAPEHGVLSYHTGDIRKYRGKPAGFWEFMNDEPSAGVTLQQLTETLDGGRIVAYESVDLTDLRTWQDVKEQLYATTIDMLATGIENLQDPTFEPETVDELGDLYTNPNTVDTIRYLIKNTIQRTRRTVG